MNALILGAGALGQPFGYHLKEGGCDLAYSVRPKYREECEEGFTLHRYRIFGSPRRHDFQDFDLYTSYGPLSEVDWDQVWLCVSSPAIRGGWLPEFLEAVGETTLVSIQPGLEDRDYLEERYPAERIVSVRVSMIAWPTPLPGENLPEGDIAYFTPPMQPIYVGGPRERAKSVAESLERGGISSGYHHNVSAYAAFSGALLEAIVAGLEVADWSLSAFRSSDALELAADAASEAIAIVSAKFDQKPPLSLRAGTSCGLLRTALPFAETFSPFPLEAYLREHFTKVGDQTRDELRTFIDAGEGYELETDALRRLLDALP